MGKKRKKDKKAPKQIRAASRGHTRGFEGGVADRLTASWTTTETSVNNEIYYALKQVRARSRDLYNNNEYGRHFFNMLVNNVVGANGIGFQSKVKRLDGTLVTRDNDLIEAQLKNWSKVGQCDVTRKLSRSQLERLFVLNLAMDGEVLIRKVRGYSNAQRYALQFLDPSLLDVDFNAQPRGSVGHITMGVETDEVGAPVAYWLLTKLPNEFNPAMAQSAERQRIPADEIIHSFATFRPGQMRGMPWVHAAMRGLKDLGGYREAAIIASRVGAAKMGVWTSPDGMSAPADGVDNLGNLIDEAAPGRFIQAPDGVTLSSWDPDYPHEQFGDFNKAFLRGIAGAFGVSYYNLNNDLESVNLSSARIGGQNERDFYRFVQNFSVETLNDNYYPEWLAMQLPAMGLPFSRFERLNAPSWRPRTWPSPDPMKDAQTNALNVGMNFTSPQRVIIGNGDDPEEILDEISQWNAKLEELGLPVPKPSQIAATEEPEAEPETEPAVEPEDDSDEEDEADAA